MRSRPVEARADASETTPVHARRPFRTRPQPLTTPRELLVSLSFKRRVRQVAPHTRLFGSDAATSELSSQASSTLSRLPPTAPRIALASSSRPSSRAVSAATHARTGASNPNACPGTTQTPLREIGGVSLMRRGERRGPTAAVRPPAPEPGRSQAIRERAAADTRRRRTHSRQRLGGFRRPEVTRRRASAQHTRPAHPQLPRPLRC